MINMDLFERELNSIKTWYAMKLEEIDSDVVS